jgi:tetratricopeptide (TPR) repeat protein
MKIRLVTVIWGREYAETFLRIGLRTLLADGNIPSLARAHQTIYTIYTTAEDALILESDQTFLLLRKAVDIHISIFAASQIDFGNHGSHGVFWDHSVELARRNSEIVFFLIPDLLYADGTLSRWALRFEEGAGAIFSIGPQVALETVAPELESRFPSSGPCSLGVDALKEIHFRHFHPLHVVMQHSRDRRSPHPEYDLRLVPGRGFVIRVLVSHPFCLDPQRYTSLRHYGPQDHLESIVFESCSTLSVEPLLRRVRLYYRKWRLDDARLSNLGCWWDHFTTSACELESTFPYQISNAIDSRWESGRQRAVASGRFFRSQVLAAGKLYRIFSEFKKRNMDRAANLLAAAVYVGRLRRHIVLDEGAILIIPSERALAGSAKSLNSLLAQGRERELINLIRDHIVYSGDQINRSPRLRRLLARNGFAKDVEPSALFTANGLPAEPLLYDTFNSGSAFFVDAFIVYTSDQVLWRTAAKSKALSAEARSNRLDKELSHGVGAAALATSNAMRALTPRLVRFRGRAYLTLRSLYYSLGSQLRTIPIIGQLLLPIHRGARFAAQTGMVLRRDGAKLFWKKLRARVWQKSVSEAVPRITEALKSASQPTISAAQSALLSEVRNIRVLKAVEEVLSEFEADMGGQEFRSAPLSYLRKMLGALELKGGSSEDIERCLTILTSSCPWWSDAWLELGFLYEDLGRSNEALICFDHASRGSDIGRVAAHDPHPAATALARLGEAYAKAGRFQEARDSFRRSLELAPYQRMAAVKYADVLRRLEEYDSALEHYANGMYYQESLWALPNPPRDARDLRFTNLEGRKENVS